MPVSEKNSPELVQKRRTILFMTNRANNVNNLGEEVKHIGLCSSPEQ
jgi:hypothetical protein